MAVLGPHEPPSGGRAPRTHLAAPLAFVMLVALLSVFATAATHGVLAQAPQGRDANYITGCTNITSPGHYVISTNITGAQAAGYCIGVFVSDVVINGGGHWLTGNGEGFGIYVALGSTNVTIEDVAVASYYDGIVVKSSGVRVMDSTVSGNGWYGVYVNGTDDSVINSNVSDSWYGVYVNGDNDSIVNSAVSGNWKGVYVFGSQDSIVNSAVSGNRYGVYVNGTDDSVINSNVSGNRYGVNIYGYYDSIVNSAVSGNVFGVYVAGSYNSFVGDRFQGDGLLLLGPYYEVVANDTVNGRPLVYLYDASNVTVSNAGEVVAFGSRGLRVVGVNVSNATVGVQLWDVNDSVIDDVVASGNVFGVNIYGYYDSIVNSAVSGNVFGVNVFGSQDSVINSTVSGNGWYGVYVNGTDDSVINSTVSGNLWYGVNITGTDDSIVNSTVSHNYGYGVYLFYDSGTLITGDIISNNGICGLFMRGSRGDLIYNNLFNNTVNVCIEGGYAYWNVSLRPGKNIVGGDMIGGNAWLSPNGTGFSQVTPALPNDPYICDKPYVINGNNTDYLPLKYPFSNNSTSTTTSTTTTTTTTTTASTTSTTTSATTTTTTTTSTTTSTPSTTTTSATATSTSTRTPSTPAASTAPSVTTSSPTTASATSARPSLPSIALAAAAAVVVVVAAAVALLLRGRR